MWEKKSNVGGVIFRIFVFLIAAALLVGFYFYYKKTTEENEEQDLAYLAQYEQQLSSQENTANTPQTGSKTGGAAEVQAAYEADLAAIQTYMPGIVCWGDVLTGGSAGGVSFPGVLQDLIDLNICDKYDFRSTVDFADNLTKIRWEDYRVDIPVVNMGVGEESSYTVLGRAGAVPYLVGEDLTVPAECEPVEIRLTNEFAKHVKPLIFGDGGVNPVVIGGIEGTLTADPSSYSQYSSGRYSFTRLTPGTETEIAKGTEIVTSGSNLYKDYIHVIFIGTYGDFYQAQELVDQQKALLARQTGNSDRYIVLGMYMSNDQSIPSSTLTQAESLMSQAFGNRFINLRKYLTGDALRDTGITATKDDESYLRNNLVPPSLRSTPYSVELNAQTYEAIGKVVYDRMDMLGYFDEIKDELGITAMEKAEKQAAAQAAAMPASK
ncbi:MAG: hypothetical protein Q4F31_02480 [Eubacteriales bacterium]|nr:hypothetical protein [Eubacteriales bacterium]